MKSLCVFVHYFSNNYIPEYVLTYLKELTNYFDDIILVTNKRDINNIGKLNKLNSVKLLEFKNEGYDFGFFYKSIHSTDIRIYDRVAFINDSNILIKSLKEIFKWSNNNLYDMWGLTDSYENVPSSKHENSYHIQSHFLVFEKKSIQYIYDFFELINFDKIFNLNLNKRKLRLKIIEDCEIGISRYMIDKGLKLGVKYKCEDFFDNDDYKKLNIHMFKWKELLENNYPLIKKKIVTNSFDLLTEKFGELIDVQSANIYINKYSNKSWKLDI